MPNEHSPDFEKIKSWYPDIYTKKMVHRCVEKGKITPEEYEEITGEKYE